MLTRILAGAMSLVLMGYVLPRSAVADGGKVGTLGEVADYAARESQSRGLEEFQGGDATGFLIGIGILAVVIYFYISLKSLSDIIGSIRIM